MSGLFTVAHAIDLALLAILVETTLLLVLRKRTGRGLAPVDLIGQLSAGAFLLVAVRLAVVGADARWILLLLTASFPAHLFDLLRRRAAARDVTRPRSTDERGDGVEPKRSIE